ncbi:MAG: ABC transporter substrate-binding protein [Pseudomonadota bacterium]
MKLQLLGAASAVAITAMTIAPAHADCGEVSISEMNWASATVVTAVSKFLMEQGYGCSVTVVPSDTVPVVTSVAETGSPDIVTEMWVNSAPVYRELEAEGKVATLGNVLSDGGVEAWWIPQYLADAHPELTTIDGVLANPELVGGRFHNCPDGWGCRTINDNLKVAYDLEGNGLEVFDHGSGETLATSIASAYADEAPWFGYYWAPTSVLGKYPMAMVDVGAYDSDAHACNIREDCATPGKSAYPNAEVLTGATTTFAEREPEIVELMRNVSFTNQQMGEILAWQEENSASPEEAAVYFLSNYKDVWADWLNDDAREKLAPLLQ